MSKSGNNKEQFVRVLLTGADVREIQWVRQSLSVPVAPQAGIRWAVTPAKTLGSARKHLSRKGIDMVIACLPSVNHAIAKFLLRLREVAPGVPIIGLARIRDEKIMATVLAIGCSEAMGKRRSDQREALSALVIAGRSRTHSPEIEKLTPRELEIFTLIAEGRSTKEVAGHLDIAVKTAETHRTNLMRKLKVHSVSQLVRFAIRHKVVEV